MLPEDPTENPPEVAPKKTEPLKSFTLESKIFFSQNLILLTSVTVKNYIFSTKSNQERSTTAWIAPR